MEKSLVSVLYHSRRWHSEKDVDGYVVDVTSYIADTPVALLVKLLESECDQQGLTLCRWQTADRYNSFVRTTSWGVVRGDRPATSYDARVIAVVRFDGNEGQTARCVAYRSLLNLLDAVMQGED